jgi:integrase
MDIMDRFRRVWQPTSYERKLPSKLQIRKGLMALKNDDEKAFYLLIATSGLRRTEAWKLKETEIDLKLRCVKPKHDTRTKKAGVSFYNQECAAYLERLQIKKGKLFRIGQRRYDYLGFSKCECWG